MLYKKLFIAALFAVFSSILYPSYAYPLELESKYFSAKIHDDIDIYALARKIDIMYYLASTAHSSSKAPNAVSILKDNLDGLYMAVSDILGIHIYSLKINLNILPTRKDISDTLKEHLEEEIDIPSYFYKDKNTIYISFEDLTIGMLAHEVSHAITARYFVVLPPPNTQEILSGYVEFSINKALNNKK